MPAFFVGAGLLESVPTRKQRTAHGLFRSRPLLAVLGRSTVRLALWWVRNVREGGAGTPGPPHSFPPESALGSLASVALSSAQVGIVVDGG